MPEFGGAESEENVWVVKFNVSEGFHAKTILISVLVHVEDDVGSLSAIYPYNVVFIDDADAFDGEVGVLSLIRGSPERFWASSHCDEHLLRRITPENGSEIPLMSISIGCTVILNDFNLFSRLGKINPHKLWILLYNDSVSPLWKVKISKTSCEIADISFFLGVKVILMERGLSVVFVVSVAYDLVIFDWGRLAVFSDCNHSMLFTLEVKPRLIFPIPSKEEFLSWESLERVNISLFISIWILISLHLHLEELIQILIKDQHVIALIKYQSLPIRSNLNVILVAFEQK